MIELKKEKGFSTKDEKLQLFKKAIMYDKFRLTKFTSGTISAKISEYNAWVFLGCNNGNVISLKLSKQRSVSLT